ncbi:ankyrin repeat domain-containing protein [Candidatus Chromulinivorax destructor]|uniref:Uncharacterized protein n=1 Tax=Candidatus Chromulinivorax destructor TaxID=2066483 RepID=A0A345ZA74_9BACT|nr:ankyrin repeat domain-containing protein [Candidatus Chromulinivorax destructor]AXK60191.1 hypothetical protein C0J27_00300 [Candidatus Chromulinivorax destructor]
MKKIKVLILLMFSLQVMSMYAAQKSQQNVENGRQAMIDYVVTRLKYLTQSFDFLREQGLVDTTFHEYLEQHVSHDEHGNEDMNFDQVIIDAEDVLTKNMKDTFLNTLDMALEESKNLDQFDDPIFLYVMQHKDDSRDLYEMVRLWLYEWGNTQDENKETPLHKALSAQNKEITRMLIDAGANVNTKNSFGQAPLHYTSSLPEIARMLIQAGADVNIKDQNRETLLHYAVRDNNIEITGILIDACADVNAQNIFGQTPLHQAIYIPKITRMLIDAGTDEHTQNENAVIKDKPEITRMLISAGADINIPNKNGQTPLYQAVICNKPKIVRMLIFAGADINIQDEHGETPLYQAVMKDKPEIARMLLSAGADINIPNKKEKTAEQEAKSTKMRMIFAQTQYARSSFCTIS